MSFDLDDLYDQTVGRMRAPSAQAVHVATEPEDIVINPADIYSSGLSSDDQLTPTDSTLNTPTITLADTFEDTTMSSKEDKLAGYAAAYAAQQDPVSPFLFPNAGLGLSSLGLKKSVKGLGSMPTANLGASFGATSSFMTNVGELFDDYGLRSSKLFSGYNPASPSAGTGGGAIDAKLLDFLNAPCLSAGEIQDNRKAAAAQALGLPSPFLPSVPTPPPASKPDYVSPLHTSVGLNRLLMFQHRPHSFPPPSLLSNATGKSHNGLNLRDPLHLARF